MGNVNPKLWNQYLDVCARYDQTPSLSDYVIWLEENDLEDPSVDYLAE